MMKSTKDQEEDEDYEEEEEEEEKELVDDQIFASCKHTAIAVCMAIAIIVIVFLVTLTVNRSITGDVSSPTGKVPASYEAVADEVDKLFDTDPNVLNRSSTPQFKAIDWFVSVDDTFVFPLETRIDEDRFTQRYSLAVFYYALGGEEWMDACNFLSPTVHECEWNCPVMSGRAGTTTHSKRRGVACDENKQVVELELFSNNMIGTIPSEIGALTDLSTMHLEDGRLLGSVPSELLTLPNLDTLRLRNLGMNGEIPTEIGYLRFLRNLDFRMNAMIGTIPSEICEAPLESLDLSSNSLTGQVPKCLGEFTGVDIIHLEDNLLSGAISFLCDTRHAGELYPDVSADCLVEVVCDCCTRCCDERNLCTTTMMTTTTTTTPTNP